MEREEEKGTAALGASLAGPPAGSSQAQSIDFRSQQTSTSSARNIRLASPSSPPPRPCHQAHLMFSRSYMARPAASNIFFLTKPQSQSPLSQSRFSLPLSLPHSIISQALSLHSKHSLRLNLATAQGWRQTRIWATGYEAWSLIELAESTRAGSAVSFGRLLWPEA